MNNPYINSLSANSQFHTISEVTQKIEDLIGTLYYLRPAVVSKTITISYDEQIESRSLIPGQNFKETLNEVRRTSTGKDAITKWYLFIKNYSSTSTREILESKIENNTNFTLGHTCSGITLETTTLLLSIGGCALTESDVLKVTNNYGCKAIPNAHSLTSLLPLIPRYEPSDKHKAKPYTSSKGDYVAAMPLSTEEAQNLLLQSIQYGKDYWGFHRSRNEYYRFKPTHTDKLIYHGFQIEVHEIPSDCLDKLTA